MGGRLAKESIAAVDEKATVPFDAPWSDDDLAVLKDKSLPMAERALRLGRLYDSCMGKASAIARAERKAQGDASAGEAALAAPPECLKTDFDPYHFLHLHGKSLIPGSFGARLEWADAVCETLVPGDSKGGSPEQVADSIIAYMMQEGYSRPEWEEGLRGGAAVRAARRWSKLDGSVTIALTLGVPRTEAKRVLEAPPLPRNEAGPEVGSLPEWQVRTKRLIEDVRLEPKDDPALRERSLWGAATALKMDAATLETLLRVARSIDNELN